MAALEGSFLKICRAQSHLDELKESIEAFVLSGPWRVVEARHPNGVNKIIRAELVATEPSKWGLIVGDFAHNARSALDHLVFEISMLAEDEPGRRSLSFPITLERDRYMNVQHQVLNGVGRPHKAIIEEYQPYHSSSVEEDHLAILAELNNADKHRLLHSVITPCGLRVQVCEGDVVQAHVPDELRTKPKRSEANSNDTIRKNIMNALLRAAHVDSSGRKYAIVFGTRVPMVQGLPIVPILENSLNRVKQVVERFQAVLGEEQLTR